MKWHRIGSNGARCLAENDVGVNFIYYLVRHSFTFINAWSSVFRACIVQNRDKKNRNSSLSIHPHLQIREIIFNRFLLK